MLAYGARLVIAGQLTAGALVVFLLYLGKMYKPMRDLSKMTDTVSKASVGFERIREVLETEGGVRDLRHARVGRPLQGRDRIRSRVVWVQPDQVILEDVSFTIEPGQVAAFVGPTGAARRPSSTWSRASTIRCPGPSRSTARIFDDSRFDRCAIRSASCCRTRCSSTRRSGRTSPTAGRKPPRRDRPRRGTGQRARVHHGDARRVRHDGRRARRDAVRRPAPAHRHRAGGDSRYADPRAGRADIRTGRAVGAGRLRGARPFDEGQDVDRHRPPSGDDPTGGGGGRAPPSG